jgi:hypothetical protein
MTHLQQSHLPCLFGLSFEPFQHRLFFITPSQISPATRSKSSARLALPWSEDASLAQ